MRTVKLFFAVNLIFIGFSFGQTKAEREKAISIVENLFYEELYLGNKVYFKMEIDYYEKEQRIEINKTAFFGEDQNTKTKTSFYLDDIDLKSMKYDLYESEPDLFFVTVQLDAKGKSIEVNSVEIDKGKFPYPVSDSNYLDKLRLAPVGKALPKRLAEKFIENIKIFLGVENYQKATLFK